MKCHLLSSSHLEYSKILLFQAATIKTAEDYIVLSGCSTSNTVRTVSQLGHEIYVVLVLVINLSLNLFPYEL